MQISKLQQDSPGKPENRTTYKSGQKGWVLKKKGDKYHSHRDTHVPEHPPHRVGLARQLQALALTNRRDAAEPSSP